MKKKILTIAVATAMAPLAAMADAVIYGKLHLSLDNVDYEDVAGPYNAGSAGYCAKNGLKGWDVCSRASRLGFKGSEDIMAGLKAIWQIEFQVALTNANSAITDGDNGQIRMRNSFVGLSGDWGTALIGRHDHPYKLATAKQDIFEDTLADYNFTAGFQDLRSDNAIAYVSPKWGGFNIAAAVVTPGTATFTGNGNVDADGIANGWSVAAQFDMAGFFAAAAYETFDEDILNATATDSWDKYRIGLGYNADMFGVNFVYENMEDYQQIFYLNGQFKFGNTALKAMYSYNEAENATSYQNWGASAFAALGPSIDANAWAIGVDHSLTKRTNAYVVYTDKNADPSRRQKDAFGIDSNYGDWSGFSLGMVHKF